MIYPFAVYAFFGFVTFAYLVSHYAYRKELFRITAIIKCIVCALGWPLYWAAAHGPQGTFQIFNDLVFQLLNGLKNLLSTLLGLLVFEPIKIVYGGIVDVINFLVSVTMSAAKNLIGSINLVFQEIEKFLTDNANLYLFAALVIIPALRLYETWDQCTTFGSCVGVVLKALLWGLAWPAFLVVRFTNILG